VICGVEKKKKNLSFTFLIIRLHHIIFCGVIIIALAACSKSDTATDEGGGSHIETPSDTTPPQISIFTPTINQVFNNGNVINITGRITDDYGLYRGTIRVVNDANGAVLLSQPYEIHGVKLYDFNINYTASVAVASDYTVSVSFEDHGLNSTSKTVKVKVNP
jgi:phosphate-selective porin